MDSLLLVVARERPDVFESLCRQCTGLEGVRVVMDRRERDGDRDTLTAVVGQNPPAGLAFFSALVREFSQRLSATDALVTEVTRWGLEAIGSELSDEPLAP